MNNRPPIGSQIADREFHMDIRYHLGVVLRRSNALAVFSSDVRNQVAITAGSGGPQNVRGEHCHTKVTAIGFLIF